MKRDIGSIEDMDNAKNAKPQPQEDNSVITKNIISRYNNMAFEDLEFSDELFDEDTFLVHHELYPAS